MTPRLRPTAWLVLALVAMVAMMSTTRLGGTLPFLSLPALFAVLMAGAVFMYVRSSSRLQAARRAEADATREEPGTP